MALISDFSKDLEAVKENYRIWKAHEKSELKFYFDTADIIDMLKGIKSLLPISGPNSKLAAYKKPKQLVHAVAYENWLGTIHLLPPHLSELYEKLDNGGIMLNYDVEDIEQSSTEFWSNEEILKKDVLAFIQGNTKGSKEETKSGLESFMKGSQHIFQGSYLMDKEANWKKRYAYLRKNKIIGFETDDIDLVSIGKDPVFIALQKELNHIRPLTSNNYMDALALCMFDRKLRDTEKNNECVFFYAEQKKLYQAIKAVSQEKIDGRYPFCFEYEDELGKQTAMAVRKADFFFLVGILRIAESDYGNIWDKLESLLESLSKSKETDKNQDNDNKRASLQLFFLEFFYSWWEKQGMQDLNLHFREDGLASKEFLDKEINNYIKDEFSSLGKHLSITPDILKILRKTISQLTDMKERVKKLYPDQFSMDAAHEFGSRFSFQPEAYEQIQQLFTQIQTAAFSDLPSDVEDIKTKVVNYIGSALKSTTYNKITDGDKTIDNNKTLNNLACAIGVLWLLGKSKLIDQICSTFENLPHLLLDSDEYPSPPFAIMHAVVLLSDGNPNLDEIERIINCVVGKYGLEANEKNYKVWLALSYAYFCMADKVFPRIFRIPEDLTEDERNSNVRKKALGYIKLTYEYAQSAYTFLKEKTLKEFHPTAQSRRNRYLYNAENNVIFGQTILLRKQELEDSKLAELVDDLESISSNPLLWHESRYADTLARYYYRLGRQKNGDIYSVGKALKYNERSLKATGISEKDLQNQLKKQLEQNISGQVLK